MVKLVQFLIINIIWLGVIFVPAAVSGGNHDTDFTPRLLPVCTESGNCGVCDFVGLLGNVTQLIVWFMATIALGFFIFSAFQIINSRGNPAEYKKGVTGIKRVVQGVALILSSWVIINLVIGLVTGGLFTDSGFEKGDVKLFKSSPWSNLCQVKVGTNKMYGIGLTSEEDVCAFYGEGTPCLVDDAGGYCEAGQCVNGNACGYLARKKVLRIASPLSNNTSYGCRSVGDCAGTQGEMKNVKECLPGVDCYLGLCAVDNSNEQVCCTGPRR